MMLIILLKMLYVIQKKIIELVIVFDILIHYLPKHESVYRISLHYAIKQFFYLFTLPYKLSLDSWKKITVINILQYVVD